MFLKKADGTVVVVRFVTNIACIFLGSCERFANPRNKKVFLSDENMDFTCVDVLHSARTTR